jgi:SH3-like domain-containing protein
MYPQRLALLLGVLAAMSAPQAGALEFRSVKTTGTLLYEAPAVSAQKLFVVSRYYPVEVLSTDGDWARVRDATGSIAWIRRAALSPQRMLLVVADRAVVRAAADASAPVAFTVPKNGVLELTRAPTGAWVAVRHRDGSSGFARLSDLWGL